MHQNNNSSYLKESSSSSNAAQLESESGRETSLSPPQLFGSELPIEPNRNAGPIQLSKNSSEDKVKDEGRPSQPFQLKSESSQKMPGDVQEKMQSSFGSDFSNISIHENSQNATKLGAKAYAQGNSISFAPGQYNPYSQSGQQLLGHELAHTVQQRQGKVSATSNNSGVRLNDSPSLESEADSMGVKAAKGEQIQPKTTNDSSLNTSISTIQKTEDENAEAENEGKEDKVIEDIGGKETIDDIFGEGFAEVYDLNLKDYYKYYDLTRTFVASILIPQEALGEINTQLDALYSVYNSLFDLVYDSCVEGHATEDQVELADNLLNEFDLRVSLVEAIYEFCALINNSGILAILKMVMTLIETMELAEHEAELRNMQDEIEREKQILINAKKDFAKAGLETALDAVIAGIGITAAIAGTATPGLNVVLLLVGIGGGYLLAREEETGVPGLVGITGAKGTNITLGTGLKMYEKANKAVETTAEIKQAADAAEKMLSPAAKGITATKFIGGGLAVIDVALDAKDTKDEWDQLRDIWDRQEAFHKDWCNRHAKLLVDHMKAQHKIKLELDRLDQTLGKNMDKLNDLSGKITGYKAEIDALSY